MLKLGVREDDFSLIQYTRSQCQSFEFLKFLIATPQISLADGWLAEG